MHPHTLPAHCGSLHFTQHARLHIWSIFDFLQEYQRCAHILKRNNCTDRKSKFLELYSLYLAGERRKRCVPDIARHVTMNPGSPCTVRGCECATKEIEGDAWLPPVDWMLRARSCSSSCKVLTPVSRMAPPAKLTMRNVEPQVIVGFLVRRTLLGVPCICSSWVQHIDQRTRGRREEMVELDGALGKANVSNRMLDSLERELEALFEAGEADAFILYVYGLVLADRCALQRLLPSNCVSK